MPQMGFDMQEGRLVRWLKAPGDRVQRGEALAEIETDKATVELEAFESGRLTRLLVEEGATVPVGEPVALLEIEDDGPAAPAPQEAPAGPRTAEPADGRVASPADGRRPGDQTPELNGEAGRRASPVARRVAQERGVDLERVQGTGPGGRILGRDVVEAPAPQTPPHPAGVQEPAHAPEERRGGRPDGRGAGTYRFEPPYHDPADYLDRPSPQATPRSTPGRSLDDIEPWTRMRQTIARRMTQAKTEIPHFYETIRVEMDQALAFRLAVNQELPEDDRITVNDLLVRASALALEEFPTLNGTYTEEGLRLNRTVDIAVAVAVEGGLLTPVVRDCGALGLVELAREVHRVVRAARKGRLKPEEYAGGTFTVSNLGMFGVESFSAIINPPQTAILAAGGTREEVVVSSGQFRPATIMRLTVAADHRVTDGVEVARFLNRIREFLEHPWLLVTPHLRG